MFSPKVEGVFYINDLLEKLMFDELKHWAGTQGTIKYCSQLKLINKFIIILIIINK